MHAGRIGTMLTAEKRPFFFEMGAKCLSLCIKMMHTALFSEPVFKVLSVLLHLAHGSIKVAANISQQN
jgi:hypothetical protein